MLSHVNLVRSYMGSLAYPRVQITLHCSLAGIPTHFQESIDSVPYWTPCSPEWNNIFVALAPMIAAPGSSGFPYLHEHQLQIQRMVSSFNAAGGANTGWRSSPPSPPPTLAGRIIGEARPVRVFHKRLAATDLVLGSQCNTQPLGTISVRPLKLCQVAGVLHCDPNTKSVAADDIGTPVLAVPHR